MFDSMVWLGRTDVVGHKLVRVMWPAEVVEQMSKEPENPPIPAQEIVHEWKWE